MKLIAKIEPQPPKGIAYMLGGETWLPIEKREPVRLAVEEWGNMGPLELRPDVPDNGHGFRVRMTYFPAPDGAIGFTDVDGELWWTDTDMFGRTESERAA
ncbi:hypothetical protein [Paraburkholderia unamae]|uniref:Uncharacterized protein n=1 Tax=Paraburkholderia unamae TaxID=219649 RepID=A0ABX5KPA5_9BURK|nr:hypothetical protein [Paraburkholderia unamae]PVX84315.1 hypothetical protein C7402_105156 [Paraburkholderia unamae]